MTAVLVHLIIHSRLAQAMPLKTHRFTGKLFITRLPDDPIETTTNPAPPSRPNITFDEVLENWNPARGKWIEDRYEAVAGDEDQAIGLIERAAQLLQGYQLNLTRVTRRVTRTRRNHDILDLDQAMIAAAVTITVNLTRSEEETAYFVELVPEFASLPGPMRECILMAYESYRKCCTASEAEARNNFKNLFLTIFANTRSKRSVENTTAFTVYDCEAPGATSWHLDLHEPGSCKPQARGRSHQVDAYAVVLHTDLGFEVSAYRCQIRYSRKISLCGFDGLSYGEVWPTVDRGMFVSSPDCRNARDTGKIMAFGREFEVSMKRTRTYQFYTRGGRDASFHCRGESFEAMGVHQSSAMEEIVLQITIDEVVGTVYDSTRRIVFANGLHAPLHQDSIIDDLVGTLVWTRDGFDYAKRCRKHQSLVYAGSVQVILHPKRTLVNVTRGDIVLLENPKDNQYAAMVLHEPGSICGMPFWKTHIEGLSIFLTHPGNLPEGDPLLDFIRAEEQRRTPQEKASQAIAQMASKTGYLHVTQSLTTEERLQTIYRQVCENERKGIYTRLAIIAAQGGPYVLLESHGPGHVVGRSGSAAIVTKCAARTAHLRGAVNCTQELPIYIAETGEEVFVDTLTRVVARQPTPTVCGPRTPTMYSIGDGNWLCSTPVIVPCATGPTQLEPTSDPELPKKDYDFTTGMAGGVFTEEQQRDLKQFLRMYNVRDAITTELAYNRMGGVAGDSIPSLFSSQDLSVITSHIGETFIPFFSYLGYNVVWYILAYLAAGALYMLLGMCLQMYSIYKIAGCGKWFLLSIIHVAFVIIAFPFELLHEVYEAARKQVPVIAPPKKKQRKTKGKKTTEEERTDESEDPEGPNGDATVPLSDDDSSESQPLRGKGGRGDDDESNSSSRTFVTAETVVHPSEVPKPEVDADGKVVDGASDPPARGATARYKLRTFAPPPSPTEMLPPYSEREAPILERVTQHLQEAPHLAHYDLSGARRALNQPAMGVRRSGGPLPKSTARNASGHWSNQALLADRMPQ